jgi:hypothetical protein
LILALLATWRFTTRPAGALPALAAAVLLSVGRPAAADPILDLPPVGRGGLLDVPDMSERKLELDPGRRRRTARAAGSTDPARLPGRGGAGELALVAEMNALGVLGAERVTIFPEVGKLDGGQPALALMRVGLVGWSGCLPLGFALRADLAEGLRLDEDDFRATPAAAVDRVLDDAYAVWFARPWFQVWAGRQPVPFSRFRQGEHALLAGGAPPFLIDRVAPERRWGAALHGDLGGIAYATGMYADADRLEMRPPAPDDMPEPSLEPEPLPDPSAGGRTAVAAHIEWTPRAPMGPGSAPSPRVDPWYDTPRASAGAGMLWRWREDGSRFDVSLSGGGKYRAGSALAELILSIDGGEVALAGAAELNLLATDNLLLFARADYDIEVDWWTIGPGATWFVTRDRWNRVSIFGWVRRESDDQGPDGDGVIVQLQTAL